jgi:predicted pyridoxine 5'-phosphate oxidase superfamily flavin-nucleotide-binding protein
MEQSISDIVFTPSVKAIQERMGSRKQYERMDERGGWQNTVNQELVEFIRERDSLYLATASAGGRPYVQHRGGPKGFLKVMDDQTLAFADFVGNRQFITIGNLSENNQAFIFLMDYVSQTRIKIWGTAEVVEGDSHFLEQLSDPGYKSHPERVIRFHVQAWDVNCRQHILPRYSEKEVEQSSTVKTLRERIEQLENENTVLREKCQSP